MEWLRVQLGFMRHRGLKAILIGHVPPAKTDSKSNWDESCWQKYVLWLQQYRDVVVGALYGHMNIDHFILQDFEEVSITTFGEESNEDRSNQTFEDESISVQSAGDYLVDLKNEWSKLPKEPIRDDLQRNFFEEGMGFLRKGKKHEKHKNKDKKYLHEIGGEWAERFALAQVGPSIIPNYFPTLRIFEYNISGIETVQQPNEKSFSYPLRRNVAQAEENNDNEMYQLNKIDFEQDYLGISEDLAAELGLERGDKKKKKKKKKGKKKKPSPIIPDPPPSDAPPGPAYSPQALTLLGYSQYYANLTAINEIASKKVHAGQDTMARRLQTNEKAGQMILKGSDSAIGSQKHKESFNFEIEYDTRKDEVFKLKDLTVRSHLRLAERIGNFESGCSYEDQDEGESLGREITEESERMDESEAFNRTKQTTDNHRKERKNKHKKKKGRKHCCDDTWFTFIRRAFIGTKDDADIEKEYG